MRGDHELLPPIALEAERSLIGSMILNKDCVDGVLELISERDLYDYQHRIIFNFVRELASAKKSIDVVTVSEAIMRSDVAEYFSNGALSFVGELAQNTPFTGNWPSYAAIVSERAAFRRYIEAGRSMMSAGYQAKDGSIMELMGDAETLLADVVSESGGERSFVSVGEALAEAIEMLETAFDNKSNVIGLPTGFADLDDLTSGLQAGDLVVVAGRPSMGKTTFAMNIAENIGVDHGKPVGVFSLEMPTNQLVTRMIASQGRVPLQRLRNGQLEPEQWPKVTSATGRIMGVDILIDDTPNLTASELRFRAKKMDRELRARGGNGLSLIVIDYLQLMRYDDDAMNGNVGISNITRSLKALAKEMELPVVILSQLNRSLEGRPNKRPLMSDLRDSGAIEQDADVIFFVYRDEVYDENSEQKGVAEIIIGKQRNGPIGHVNLAFLNEFVRFENYTTTF